MGYRYINQLATTENIQKFLEFVDLAAGSGVDTNNVFDLDDRFRDSPQMQITMKKLAEDPTSVQMIAEKYMGSDYDLETMLKMPKKSLGWTYAKVVNALGYDPKFYRLRPMDSDVDYVLNRWRKTHDLHHILTGFALDSQGELGVISVTVAQIGLPVFLFLDLIALLMSFLNAGKNDQGLEKLKFSFDLISAGIQMGREAKLLFPIKWEEGFERPLDEWREELNIKPILAGNFSWYSNPILQEAIS
ncbi:uncharacterized protein involved in ubiquinone biosynthesis [Cylindrospermum stagnale PCC 7417]|uniref:Uncharacterized protein involved in ubiquinone biosynthesis n=1 Tax=Cylindrospermum stagnale PCC 7417 TaxID=56107 RepID=K9WQK1_9NOST|nr:Coq4 family protein [Cylindrospermum stagnale]AFZ22655.1 uncharacterized protein involved in ubiquinone biosynthesis [Cylindrospermum stagnale PCC 7417]